MVRTVAAIVAALAVAATAGVAAHGATTPSATPSANVVVVTTTADLINGRTSSLAALKAHPGRDGISLREALTAANKTKGSQTVYIMFNAALNSRTIELRTPLPTIHRNLCGRGSPVQLHGRVSRREARCVRAGWGELRFPLSGDSRVVSARGDRRPAG